MPSRIIKETIIISESLTAISAEAERFFWRLVVKVDDFGLYYGDPRILASLCFMPIVFPETAAIILTAGKMEFRIFESVD